jgi:Type I phosphodiesterase / nucleotide pyrophosphatase
MLFPFRPNVTRVSKVDHLGGERTADTEYRRAWNQTGQARTISEATANRTGPGSCLSRMCLLINVRFLVLATFFLFSLPGVSAQTKRLVVFKVDALPDDTVDHFVHERDPLTGKSQLPWIDYVFYKRGTRIANFYVRGMSLSTPSWSLLETGQHLQLKGNVEFDRYTLESYDYLNFFPFLLQGARRTRVDTPGVEVLDSVGVPLLIDAYPYNERYLGFSLYQRGTRFGTFANGFLAHFNRAPKEIFDEWTMGIELGGTPVEGMLKELIDRLNNPDIRYLSLMVQDFDHTAHHNGDRESQLAALKRIDAVVGCIWTAIQKSPLAEETALVIVSDHGMNSDERVLSQGYNLVRFLGSSVGGGHHVVTQRRLLLDYSIRGVDPFIPLITTSSRDSYYLKGEGDRYPTALLDFDGNERASIHLRDDDLNVLHILLRQLQRKDLVPQMRRALTEAFFSTIDRRRDEWQIKLNGLNEELGALRRGIDKQRDLWKAQPKKFTKADEQSGRDDEVRRIFSQLDRWIGQERDYSEYARTLSNLLALRESDFQPARVRLEDVIPRRSMGERNNVHQLQNYLVGVSPNGLAIKQDGSLDIDKSFVRIDYFALLHGIGVRNNVQSGISNRPIDMIATRIPSRLVRRSLSESEELAPDAIWVYAGADRQALIVARENGIDQVSLRFQSIKHLEADAAGHIHFELTRWQSGLPLKIFEDPRLAIPGGDRETWLSQWHTDTEWLEALHRTQYSNALIGLYEELARHWPEGDTADGSLSEDARLMRRFVRRRRELIEADMLLVANNHWNFDVRGFNPGGNHGSFFRISTHSAWMMAGGERTGIPRGLVVEEPYDSLSFVPTLLVLTGRLRDDMSPALVLFEKGFRRFPGRVVKEVIAAPLPRPKIADEASTAGP